jgi:prepilin-type N-terminal cleavage/methylation domain-containing protein
MQSYKSRRSQSGFTLVEIAIVLVIVGLLLAGVLKGQELIENSKIKNISKDMDGMSAAVLSFRDRYKALPGDDAANTTTAYGWAANVGGGNGDGFIGAALPSFTGASAEQVNAIRALRFAGFLSGDPATAGAPALPSHAGGGRMAIGGIAAGTLGLTGNVVCVNGLSGKYAGALDRLIDDGVNSTGAVRGTTAALASAAPAAAAYAENTLNFTVCKQV